MKAVTWRGVNEIGVEDVPEPTILNDHDIILEVGPDRDLRLGPAPGGRLHPRHARR